MRKQDPKTTGLIFGSGKIIVIGAKSIEASITSARKIANDIGRVFNNKTINFEQSNFQINNIVASCFIGYKINRSNIDNDEIHK